MNLGEVLTAMVTPFTPEGKLSLKEVPQLVKHLVEGSHGLLVVGTTGESPSLSNREKMVLLEEVCRVREEMGKDFSIIAGTGTYNTWESRVFTRETKKLPLDGIMLVTPYYNRPTQEGLINHFTAVASETPLPVILYNVPSRTGCNLEVKTAIHLSQVPNIVAIKEASGNLDQVSSICREKDNDFFIYSGDDSLTLPILSVGGHGVISVASHLVGVRIKEMIRSFKEGQVREAFGIHHQLFSLFKALFTCTNPIPVKAALNLIGLEVGPPRSPLHPLPAKEMDALKKILETYSLSCKKGENRI